MKYENVVIDHIPADSKKRPGRPLRPEYITVHNTGNPKSTAANERAYLTNPTNTTTTAYHIVVDSTQAIECVPLDEVAYHAGDGRWGIGNTRSIGIEICESGDPAANETAAIELIADLLTRYGWSVEHVKPHKHWSGKNCPRLILPHWEEFIQRIKAQMPSKGSPAVKNLTVLVKGEAVTVKAVNIDGANYVSLRDVPRLIPPIVIGYDEQQNLPTIE